MTFKFYLHSDYIKSCANLDVCRQLVLVFDVIHCLFVNFN